jgi:hypothetical protein
MMAVKSNKAKKKVKQKWTKPVAGISFPYYDDNGNRTFHSLQEDEMREFGMPESLIEKVKWHQAEFIRQLNHDISEEEEDDIVNFLNS